MRSILVGALVALALSGPSFAGPITVDGNVSDWGITVGDNNSSNFSAPGVIGTVLNQTFFFALEDAPDNSGDAYFLGPHYGGQNYDAEFMGLAFSGTTMYLTIVTGQRPDNGFSKFSPGDIRIVAKESKNGPVTSTFGIEVGGGRGGASDLNRLTAGGDGSTYTLNSSGYTIGHANSPRTVGSVWQNPNWLLDPIAYEAQVQMTNDLTGTPVGTADFVYTRNGDPTKQHAVIELALNLSIFDGAGALDIYWAPSCNNDVLEINDDLPGGRVPEPGTLAALGIGFLAIRLVRRRR
jgi:hypothetical protein